MTGAGFIRNYVLRVAVLTYPQQWLNCETKIFSFESDGDDEEAAMVEVPAEGKIRPKDATAAPTTQEMV